MSQLLWLLQVSFAALRLEEGGQSMADDSAYFERRASEETTAAKRAEHPRAREVHLQMAELYNGLVDEARLG